METRPITKPMTERERRRYEIARTMLPVISEREMTMESGKKMRLTVKDAVEYAVFYADELLKELEKKPE